ncbi:hypothetical protein J5N97_010689 [Dioscorea zingiberensis]|uniref:GH18 domain-containing protein n=1 Tax=Dioscorea zingiberensis TaxID=325984 RepID=A0A9D5D0N8_9LILI|nr:hypothetical protein J5N97_010689 [Dioscorea zingiberensis]
MQTLAAQDSNLFREYIGALYNDVKFSDVPINSGITDFHFILAFAIDYTDTTSPSPTNGQFNIFWDSTNLSPSQVSSIKQTNANVKVALSIGGDIVHGVPAKFSPYSIDSWVNNAVISLTKIIQEYDLDGIDIDYEHFNTDPETFAASIGQLITTLKINGVISFASIAPFEAVNSYYSALWREYASVIDYVNFQFYAYDATTNVSQFLSYFDKQSCMYNGGRMLASMATGANARGLSPENGFFDACATLKEEGKLNGIFIWSADGSKASITFLSMQTLTAQNSNLFREYIGALYNGVKFSDVPINSGIDFHFILAFAIDYTDTTSPTPTNGQFNIFWDSTLSPAQVSSIKQNNANVKVALSIGGDTVHGLPVNFSPSSIDSWVDNAVKSLTSIIQEYNLDGIDIDYEHFNTDTATFAASIGKLITTLKNNGVISFASIAPYDNEEVQSHYQALWKDYASVIDYVNFQFYAYSSDTTVSQFLNYFEAQRNNYNGGKILASIGSSASSGGLSPANGFFDACTTLKTQGKLSGIFIWSADNSLANGFVYEKQAQSLLASAR